MGVGGLKARNQLNRLWIGCFIGPWVISFWSYLDNYSCAFPLLLLEWFPGNRKPSCHPREKALAFPSTYVPLTLPHVEKVNDVDKYLTRLVNIQQKLFKHQNQEWQRH